MTSAASPATRSATAALPKALSIALWALQVLLACFFTMVGYSHALMPFEQIAPQATWMNDVPRWLSLFIGYAEIAGGLGLIIPAATRIAPWLTPAAALGLATIMILAIPFHVLKGEASVVWMHALLAALAVFVAWGRWHKAPISGRWNRGSMV
jgi:putative oxidoreductase